MPNEISELQILCDSYALKLEVFSGGHCRLSNHGSCVDYWPTSKKRTARKNGQNTYHCTPFDAVQLCLKGVKVSVDKKRGPIGKKAPPANIQPFRTVGVLKHFDTREIPWEGEPWMAESDKVRWEAWELQNRAIQMRAEADEMDDDDAATEELDRQLIASSPITNHSGGNENETKLHRT